MQEPEYFKNNVKALQETLQKIYCAESFNESIKNIVEKCVQALLNGNTLYFAGNGGSAAEAQHIAAEFVGRFQIERKGYPAIALTTDTSAITSIGNDYTYEEIFSRQAQALIDKGDIIFLLSTSGNSINLIQACEQSRNKGAFCIGLLGKNGGLLKEKCDIVIIVPTESTARIQEIHLLILHSICEATELQLANLGI